MKPVLRYIELKSGFSHDGPAWIGSVKFSKSGKTIYFNDKALKRANGPIIRGNYYDLESGEEYWVSGIKKDGTDRHWTGNGKIMIDEKIVDLYLRHVDFDRLDKAIYEIVEVKSTDKQRFVKIENERLGRV